MGFGVHSAVVLVEAAAGAMRLAARGSSARRAEVPEKVGESCPACRDTFKVPGMLGSK